MVGLRAAGAVKRFADVTSTDCAKLKMWKIGSPQPAARSPQPSARPVHQILHQHRYGPAGCGTLAALLPGGAGDIQMRPAIAFGEARQEAAGGDGTGVLAA